jgi:flagella basal body P-ring formation protein FlgA
MRFHWKWEREVWQAKYAVQSGQLLEPQDFKAVTRDVLQLPGEPYIGPIDQADGTASRFLQSGVILTAADIKPEVLVKQGSSVMVNYSVKQLHVALKGTALENGCKGQIITVRNETSSKKFNARVLGEGVLEYVQ